MLAICNECGTIRTIQSTNAVHGRDTSHEGVAGAEGPAGDRCMVIRKCRHCARLTRHAYLRDDAHRDHAEREQRTADEHLRNAEVEMASLTESFDAIGVNVRVGEQPFNPLPGPVIIGRFARDGRYFIAVDSSVDAITRCAALRVAWDLVTTDRCDGRWYFHSGEVTGEPIVFCVLTARRG